MHVAINLLSAGSGGAINYARSLTPLLNATIEARGGKLTVIAYDGLLSTSSLGQNGIHDLVVFPRRSGLARVAWERVHLRNVLKNINPDIVFFPHQIGPKIEEVPVVMMIRNMEPFFFNAYPSPLKKKIRNYVLREASKRSCRRASHVVCVSKYVHAYAAKELGIVGACTSVIYHGRDPRFSPNQAVTDKAVLSKYQLDEAGFLLTCGSLLPYRRCEDIVRSFLENVSPQFPGLKLIVSGAVLDRHYFEKICSPQHAPNKKVHFVGHVSPDDLAALYRHCKLFITATEIEACPNIAIEALASGCKIVSAMTQPLMEIFGAAAAYYPRRSVLELSNTITTLLSNTERHDEMAQIALARSQDFSWEKCAQETYEMLVSVCNSPKQYALRQ